MNTFCGFGLKNDSLFSKYWSREEPRIPWRAICLALFLLVVGFGLLLLSVLISFGFIETTQTNNQSLVLLFLGSIMFIPGFYHMRIAFYAYYRYDGFTFDKIPDFD